MVVSVGRTAIAGHGRAAGHGGRRPDLEKEIGFSTVELMMNVSRPI
jgi:hypothetical protein